MFKDQRQSFESSVIGHKPIDEIGEEGPGYNEGAGRSYNSSRSNNWPAIKVSITDFVLHLNLRDGH